MSIALLLTSCAGSGSAQIYRDPHGSITVKSSATFALSLPENSSAGSTWRLLAQPDPGVLQSAGDAYSADRPGVTGSGGQHRFSFRAQHTGRAVLRFRRFFRGKPRERRAVVVRVG